MMTVDGVKLGAVMEDLLGRVAAGESVLITRDGIAVAALVPPVQRAPDAQVVAQRIRSFRVGHRAGGDLQAFISEGRV